MEFLDTADTLITIPAIYGLVNVFIDAGMPKRLAPLTAILLGVGLSVATQHYGEAPWFVAASVGLRIGLASMGTADITQRLGKSPRGKHAATTQ